MAGAGKMALVLLAGHLQMRRARPGLRVARAALQERVPGVDRGLIVGWRHPAGPLDADLFAREHAEDEHGEAAGLALRRLGVAEPHPERRRPGHCAVAGVQMDPGHEAAARMDEKAHPGRVPPLRMHERAALRAGRCGPLARPESVVLSDQPHGFGTVSLCRSGGFPDSRQFNCAGSGAAPIYALAPAGATRNCPPVVIRR